MTKLELEATNADFLPVYDMPVLLSSLRHLQVYNDYLILDKISEGADDWIPAWRYGRQVPDGLIQKQDFVKARRDVY